MLFCTITDNVVALYDTYMYVCTYLIVYTIHYSRYGFVYIFVLFCSVWGWELCILSGVIC